MANHIQKVMYEGFLGADPEMRFTPSGAPVTNFNLGSSVSYKGKDGETVKTTTWLRVTAWGNLAEIVNKYCAKGSHVIVEGVLKGNERGHPAVFATKNGESSASFDVTANSVRIIKGKDGASDKEVVVPNEDDLPF